MPNPYILHQSLDDDCACLCVTETTPSGIGICFKDLHINTVGGPVYSNSGDRVCISFYGDFAGCYLGQKVSCDNITCGLSVGVASSGGTIEVTGFGLPLVAPPNTRAGSLCSFKMQNCFDITGVNMTEDRAYSGFIRLSFFVYDQPACGIETLYGNKLILDGNILTSGDAAFEGPGRGRGGGRGRGRGKSPKLLVSADAPDFPLKEFTDPQVIASGTADAGQQSPPSGKLPPIPK